MKLFRGARRSAGDREPETDGAQDEDRRVTVASGRSNYSTRITLRRVTASRRMRVLGVDVGERRVGLAISDASRTLARPLETIAVDQRGGRRRSKRRRRRRNRRAVPNGRRWARARRRRDAGAPRRHAEPADRLMSSTRSSTRCARRRTPLPIVTRGRRRLTSREAESRLAVTRARLAQAQGAARRSSRRRPSSCRTIWIGPPETGHGSSMHEKIARVWFFCPC